MKEETQTPYVSLHLEASLKDFPGYHPEKLSQAQANFVKATILRDVETALKMFQPEEIIIENVPYRGVFGKVLRTSVEPETLTELLNQTNTGLLLNISHARISANYLGISEKDYMNQLPTGRIKELHFTGLHHFNGWLQDHLDTTPGDWPVLDWVLKQTKNENWSEPWLLAYEVGGVGEKFTWRSDGQALERDISLLFNKLNL